VKIKKTIDDLKEVGNEQTASYKYGTGLVCNSSTGS
jgi:hypothetical protein